MFIGITAVACHFSEHSTDKRIRTNDYVSENPHNMRLWHGTMMMMMMIAMTKTFFVSLCLLRYLHFHLCSFPWCILFDCLLLLFNWQKPTECVNFMYSLIMAVILYDVLVSFLFKCHYNFYVFFFYSAYLLSLDRARSLPHSSKSSFPPCPLCVLLLLQHVFFKIYAYYIFYSLLQMTYTHTHFDFFCICAGCFSFQ